MKGLSHSDNCHLIIFITEISCLYLYHTLSSSILWRKYFKQPIDRCKLFRILSSKRAELNISYSEYYIMPITTMTISFDKGKTFYFKNVCLGNLELWITPIWRLTVYTIPKTQPYHTIRKRVQFPISGKQIIIYSLVRIFLLIIIIIILMKIEKRRETKVGIGFHLHTSLSCQTFGLLRRRIATIVWLLCTDIRCKFEKIFPIGFLVKSAQI